MQQIEAIFHDACNLAPDGRAAFLAQACAGDEDLRREVELLLASDEEVGSLIEAPAYELAATLIASSEPRMKPGISISHYKILAPLGAGGMGEVWRARDTDLKRDVAIKLLPVEFAHDAERLSRFEREARAASALNHPNIITIHEIGSIENTRFIVTELIDGQTLRQQIESSRMKLPEILKIAIQIASALAAAHDAGIIHRDIKPENVMVRSDGLVKVLDFGLAKLKPEQPTGDEEADTVVQAQSPKSKVQSPKPQSTLPGVVMGTVGYMSPEQVRGQKADHRSDIFSFGVLLYEMLSGQRPFQGKSMAETMAAIANDEPPELASLNSQVSAPLERILKHCLEKQAERRFHSAHDLGFALEALSASTGSPQEITLLAEHGSNWRLFGNARLAWSVAAVILLATIAWFAYIRRAPTEVKAFRFSVSLPQKATNFGSPAISPDGRHLAFTALTEGKVLLWVRTLDSIEAKALPGTENARFPFWSPDSRQIAFFAQTKLKKVSLSGGSPTTICDAPGIMSQGTTWGHDGMILFLSSEYGHYRVSDQGGAVEKLQPYLGWADYPTLLPDGKHFLYAKAGAKDGSGIYLASIDGQENRRLLPADYSRTAYTTSQEGKGYILFVREGSLLAQPFDATQRRLTVEPVRLADQVAPGSVTVSENGVLVYRTTDGINKQQPGWFDRSGKPLGTIGAPAIVKPSAGQLTPALSPDETQVAVGRLDPQTANTDIWLLDLARGTESRFTFDQALDNNPVWSPDGSRIIWNSNREKETRSDLYHKPAGSAGQDELLFKSDYWTVPLDWSGNGDILFQENNPTTKYDLWILPFNEKGKPYPYLQNPFNESNARFSPDARWITYVSDESGRNELYAQAFPSDGIRHPISNSGLAAAQASRWRRDGKELFYVAADGNMMVVEVSTASTFKAGTPRALFNLRSMQALPDHFFVTRDGKRFLIKTIVGDTTPKPFTVVTNWSAELPR